MGLILHVRLTPRAGVDRIDGWGLDPDGRPTLIVRVRAAPSEGEANAALEGLIAKSLRIGRSSVSVVRGGRARLKTVAVEGVGDGDIAQALGTAPSQPRTALRE